LLQETDFPSIEQFHLNVSFVPRVKFVELVTFANDPVDPTEPTLHGLV
jgi:hypothetical protein